MKQIPISLSDDSDTDGIAETFTPNAVSRSALPDLLLAARLPCFATGSPAPAITNAAAVEMLKVLAGLEPVPAVSMKHECLEFTRTARDRNPWTNQIGRASCRERGENRAGAV